jgi:hypothetical protein
MFSIEHTHPSFISREYYFGCVVNIYSNIPIYLF